MKKALALLLLLLPFVTHAQDRASLLKTAVLNANAKDTFLLRDSVIAHIYYDEESDSMLLADLQRDPGLSKADVEYMRMQLKNYQPHTWTTDSIKGAVIVPSKETPSASLSPKKATKAWSAYFKTHNTGYYEVSEPVFSKDGTYAIVYTGFQCGAGCGNGGATLYHFENGQWKPVKNLFSCRK